RALGTGPLSIGLIWRAWAGVGIALGWFVLIRHYVRRPWLTAALTIFCLADIGTLSCRPLLRQVVVARQVAREPAADLLARTPQIHHLWRVITPALSLAPL